MLLDDQRREAVDFRQRLEARCGRSLQTECARDQRAIAHGWPIVLDRLSGAEKCGCSSLASSSCLQCVAMPFDLAPCDKCCDEARCLLVPQFTVCCRHERLQIAADLRLTTATTGDADEEDLSQPRGLLRSADGGFLDGNWAVHRALLLRVRARSRSNGMRASSIAVRSERPNSTGRANHRSWMLLCGKRSRGQAPCLANPRNHADRPVADAELPQKE